MDKFIFLDIDGVIATPKKITHGTWDLTDECQRNLGIILKKTKAKIIISSSWRMSTLENTKEKLKEHGFLFVDDIIGQTIRGYDYIQKGVHFSIPRGVEIKQWMDTKIHSDDGKNFNRKKINVDFTYVIIDDDSDMLLEHKNNFVKTYSRLGLSYQDVTECIRILNNE